MKNLALFLVFLIVFVIFSPSIISADNIGIGTTASSGIGTTNPITSPQTPGAPDMVFPQNNQILDLEGAYMFKVQPVAGASGYLFGLFQDNVMVYENWRD